MQRHKFLGEAPEAPEISPLSHFTMHGTAEQAAAYLELNEKDIIPPLHKIVKTHSLTLLRVKFSRHSSNIIRLPYGTHSEDCNDLNLQRF